MEHSHLPFVYKNGSIYNVDGRLIQADRDNPNTTGHERDTNLRFITHACNNYDKLIAALQEIANICQTLNDRDFANIFGHKPMLMRKLAQDTLSEVLTI